MNELILTVEQTRQLAAARGPVVVKDAAGTELGTIDPYEAEVIRRHKERKGQPRKPGIPSAVVRRHMQELLAERERRGGVMTPEEGIAFVRQLQERDGS
ncbi:MAG: hypothetical protein MUF18_00405 [Fimbriiglobus sp.]|jgi:hypothetical protein|nr:hypothetical protein [Fimbriiglobus sp.]